MSATVACHVTDVVVLVVLSDAKSILAEVKRRKLFHFSELDIVLE